MTCPDCARSATELWHVFNANCRGCQARVLSRSTHFSRVRKNNRLDRVYQAALDQLGLTHKEVKQAWNSDAINRSAN